MSLRVSAIVASAVWLTLCWSGPATAESLPSLDQARALHLNGQWREALAVYKQVATGGEPANAALALNNACVIHNRLAEYSAALESCREALRLRRELGDERRLGRTLNNLGLALQRLGQYREAKLSYREALEINERRGDVEAQLINLQNLGLTATEAGHYGEALELFDGATELATEQGDEGWALTQGALARLNRGVVLEKLGAYREALDLYLSLAEERERLDDGSWASLQVNLGVMYRNLGDPVRAVAAFEEAVGVYEQLGDNAALSNATLNLALAWHLNLGRPKDAETAYRRALELARGSGDRAEEIQDLFYLGRLLLDLERWQEAESSFEQCLDASEVAGSAEGRWSAIYGLGRVAAARGEKRQALARFEDAIDEIEEVRAGLAGGELRAGYFGDKRPVYAAAVQILADLEMEEPGAGHGSRGLEIVQRTKARELLESLGSGGGVKPPTPRTAAELVSQVGRDAVIEYFASGDRLYRWLILEGKIHFDDLGPQRPILEVVQEVHQALASGQRPALELMEQLTLGLLSNLDADVSAVSKLWIAPDGALHYLPFELLSLSGGEATPLVEEIESAYLPSTSALGWLHRKHESSEVVLFGVGDPRLPGDEDAALSGRLAARYGLRPLPAAARELTAIRDLLGRDSEIATGERATEEAFRRGANRGARIVHLATHTVVDEQPGQGAAILLTPAGDDDGLLRPAEIAGLDLQVDLTVLAACSSALGGAEGGRAFASLTGAFLAAGSPAVVASLWDVGDEASAVFMSQFYYQLSRGHAPADALRRAKLRLRADPAWDRPDLWAAFVLVGDAPSVIPRRLVPFWAWGLAALVVALFALRHWVRPSSSP